MQAAQNLAHLSRRLKEVADKELRKELFKSINHAVKPLSQEVKSIESLNRYLPDDYVAEGLARSLRIRARSRAVGKNPAVFLVGQAKGRKRLRSIGAMDRGTLRHPLFGKWRSESGKAIAVDQRIKPGFWSEPLNKNVRVVRKELVKGLERIARMVTEKHGPGF